MYVSNDTLVLKRVPKGDSTVIEILSAPENIIIDPSYLRGSHVDLRVTVTGVNGTAAYKMKAAYDGKSFYGRLLSSKIDGIEKVYLGD